MSSSYRAHAALGMLNHLIDEEESVLFLDLDENESGPNVLIPVYIALSNRFAFDVTKTYEKAEAVYVLIDPLKPEEVVEIGVYIHRHMGTESIFNDSDTPKDRREVREVMEERVSLTGPVLRTY